MQGMKGPVMAALIAVSGAAAAQPATIPPAGPVILQGDVRVAADGKVTLEGVDRAAPDLVATMRPLIEGLDVAPGQRDGRPVEVRTRFLARMKTIGPDVSTWELGRVTFGPTTPVPAVAYPVDAARRGEGGHVALRLRVAADGRVEIVETLQGVRPFKAAVTDAVAGWTLSPLLVDGVATPVEIVFASSFRMQGGKPVKPADPVCVARDPLLPRVRGDSDCVDP